MFHIVKNIKDYWVKIQKQMKIFMFYGKHGPVEEEVAMALKWKNEFAALVKGLDTVDLKAALTLLQFPKI